MEWPPEPAPSRRFDGKRCHRHRYGDVGRGLGCAAQTDDCRQKAERASGRRAHGRDSGFRSVTRPAWHILRAVASELCVPGFHRVCRYRGRLGPCNLAPTPFQKKSVKVPLTESYPWRRESQSMQLKPPPEQRSSLHPCAHQPLPAAHRINHCQAIACIAYFHLFNVQERAS
jgi:hypothetical protein